MATLSMKARLFLDAALVEPRTARLCDEVRSLGEDPWSKPLSPHAIRIALDVYGETEKGIRDRLGDPKLGVDEEAELLNDLGFIQAVQADLQRDLKRP